MSIRHSVYIVASPRPRVGKTLLSRLLIDYHKHEGREFGAFDLNSGDHTLKQFAPDDVTAANIGSVKGQMALFDSLVSEQGGGKVVDVGGDAYKNFFDVAYRIGLVEEAHKRDIAPVILFIVSSDKQAADVYRDLRTRFPGAALTPVHNEMLGLAQHRDRFPPSGQGGAILRMPVLAPGLRKYIETPPFGFADEQLANARHIPLDAHIEIQRWLRKAYLEFRELDLRILLGELQTSLRM
ncbi:hypothetical protein ASD45_18375 [Pseudolabrys sp. Root1462]|uniref:hypothetical protein n=1 Tax=Pseudolabrys sp. Root1462 TaxID=1736466 RepID=UPI000702F1CD|nr:hypothetical protein [Pseudolabrys sp. Root1462]KQY97955.1 hypothetical protein ASD45_18375 [Pseudolabrys sp. Root1462]